MSTIIDQLFVTLGLDVKAFKKGKDDAIKISDDLNKHEKKNSEERRHDEKKNDEQSRKNDAGFKKRTKEKTYDLKQFRNELLKVSALFMGGMGMLKFAQHSILTSANLGRMGNDLDMSASKLRAWQLASESVGGSSEEMTAALIRANQTIGTLKTGRGDWSQFTAMQNLAGMAGVGMQGPQTFSSPTQIMLAQSKIVQGLIRKFGTGTAFQQAQSQLGMDQGTFDLLKRGPDYVERMVAAQRPLAESQARLSNRAQILQAKMVALKGEFESVGVTILTDLLPVFDRMLAAFKKFGDWLDQHKGKINEWMGKGTSAALKFADAADRGAQALGGWKNVIEALLALKIAALVTRLAGLAGALRGIGGSAAMLGSIGQLGMLGVAGAGGYGMGNWLYNNVISGSSFGDFLGHNLARGMSLFGSDDASWAVNHDQSINGGWGSSPRRHMNDAANWIRSMPAPSASPASVTIDNLTINTQATDADGIARNIKPALARHMTSVQLNSGQR